jgi:heme-degrading monooxygenase HmoA
LWVTRESHLDEVKGFRAFHLLRGPERDDHVLYSSHTIWASSSARRCARRSSFQAEGFPS